MSKQYLGLAEELVVGVGVELVVVVELGVVIELVSIALVVVGVELDVVGLGVVVGVVVELVSVELDVVEARVEELLLLLAWVEVPVEVLLLLLLLLVVLTWVELLVDDEVARLVSVLKNKQTLFNVVVESRQSKMKGCLDHFKNKPLRVEPNLGNV